MEHHTVNPDWPNGGREAGHAQTTDLPIYNELNDRYNHLEVKQKMPY